MKVLLGLCLLCNQPGIGAGELSLDVLELLRCLLSLESFQLQALVLACILHQSLVYLCLFELHGVAFLVQFADLSIKCIDLPHLVEALLLVLPAELKSLPLVLLSDLAHLCLLLQAVLLAC